jgi:hypothetical protein
MSILVIPAILVGLLFAWALNRAFRGVQRSPDRKIRFAAGAGKSFLLWLIVGASPFLLILLSGPGRSLYMFMTGLAVELPMALIGTIVLWFGVPAKKSALLIGLLVGGALAPLVLWSLALILPKNETTMGLALYGIILAAPNAFAGAVAGHWRAQSAIGSAEAKSRPLPL